MLRAELGSAQADACASRPNNLLNVYQILEIAEK